LYPNNPHSFAQKRLVYPKVTSFHLLLGTIHYDLKQYEEARSALQQALRLKPDFALAHFYLGRTYLRLGRKPEAMQVYRTLLPLDKTKGRAALR
jgi:tetratricopeptide (TPR) repeat protein